MRSPRIRRRRAGQRLRRGVYLIPSLFTIANILCGFTALIDSSQGRYKRAAVLILVAIIADILDGRIARLTGTTSAFGEAYDSLADVVSFGAAPALLVYHWGLRLQPDLGLFCSFLFLVAGSIRLARFNTSVHDSRNFLGLPIPAGAGSISMLVLSSPTPVSHTAFIPVVMGFVLCLALLMVSNLPYRSFKDLNMRRQWPAPTLFAIALVVSLVTLRPYLLSILAAVYVLSAPVAVVTGRARAGRRKDPGARSHHGPDDTESPDR